MTQISREALSRAWGILQGLSVSENLTDSETTLILNVARMIDTVLGEDTDDGT